MWRLQRCVEALEAPSHPLMVQPYAMERGGLKRSERWEEQAHRLCLLILSCSFQNEIMYHMDNTRATHTSLHTTHALQHLLYRHGGGSVAMRVCVCERILSRVVIPNKVAPALLVVSTLGPVAVVLSSI